MGQSCSKPHTPTVLSIPVRSSQAATPKRSSTAKLAVSPNTRSHRLSDGLNFDPKLLCPTPRGAIESQHKTGNRESDPIFDALARGKGFISSKYLINALRAVGLRMSDPRLKSLKTRIDNFGVKDARLNRDEFNQALSGCEVLVRKALTGNLIIPDWSGFRKDLEEIYKATKTNKSGHNADYIPTLEEVDPNKFAISVCTVDGQCFSIGDAEERFCIQSCSKPITYLMALQENGSDYVHTHVGQEPSGQAFNNLDLKTMKSGGHKHGGKIETTNPLAVPHNPMINSGAIMSIAMIEREATLKTRLEKIKRTLEELAGNKKVYFNDKCFQSEHETADRNRCLAYMMREQQAFPTKTSVDETLELYFSSCALEMTNSQMSILAATLANGGKCPLSNQVIFEPKYVRYCLSLMLSCGMYDYSGEWAFKIGLPAKSGVGGSVFIVVPNKMGFCVWSPRLDSHGNSVRGVEFAKRLIEKFNFHHFDNIRGILSGSKKDPCETYSLVQENKVVMVLFAAARGDLEELHQLHAQGCDLYGHDYDNRSPLHLAASEGHLDVVNYLIHDVNGDYVSNDLINVKDRWGDTPLDGAIASEHMDVAEILKEAGAVSTKAVKNDDGNTLKPSSNASSRRQSIRGLHQMIRASPRKLGKESTAVTIMVGE